MKKEYKITKYRIRYGCEYLCRANLRALQMARASGDPEA